MKVPGKVYVCFRPCCDEPEDNPADYMSAVWEDKDALVEHLLRKLEGRTYGKCYKNVTHRINKHGTAINAYADLADGYSTGIKKRTDVIIDTVFIIREVWLNKSVEDE